MEADGANIRQIGHNTLFEGRGSLLPDGRVLYTRWEYVDKHFSSAYGLWTANPDGTNQTLFYGGLAWQPGAMVDARAIPGSRHVVCVFRQRPRSGLGRDGRRRSGPGQRRPGDRGAKLAGRPLVRT